MTKETTSLQESNWWQERRNMIQTIRWGMYEDQREIQDENLERISKGAIVNIVGQPSLFPLALVPNIVRNLPLKDQALVSYLVTFRSFGNNQVIQVQDGQDNSLQLPYRNVVVIGDLIRNDEETLAELQLARKSWNPNFPQPIWIIATQEQNIRKLSKSTEIKDDVVIIKARPYSLEEVGVIYPDPRPETIKYIYDLTQGNPKAVMAKVNDFMDMMETINSL